MLAGKAGGEVEAIFRTKSGEAIYVRGTANPKIEAGTLISSREIYRDISARMALERTKDEFVSVVSHELRTPLTSLRASLGLLASGVLDDQPEKTGRMLEVAVSNTERLVRLINDILDVERIESGLVTMDIQPWNVRELLEQASGEMSSLAGASGVSLKVESSPDLTMLIDRDRMIQTLANLISNAIKFSDPGADVLIRAHADDSRVVVEIEDHGRGIPSEKLETVFDKFQQVDASVSREMGGTGLGLTICKSIIEQHGGEIAVESIEGEGSTFTFWVPVIPERFVRPNSALDLSVGTV
jgi:signal transduction histidine kinase